MMSSRSIIWSLTHHDVPSPPEDVRRGMVEELRSKLPEDQLPYYLNNAHAVIDEANLFDNPPVLRRTSSASESSPEPLIEALGNLRKVEGHRERFGRTSVQQHIDEDFLHAAIHQWVRADGTGARENDLRESGIIDRLEENDFLSRETSANLRGTSDRWEPPKVPRDFCDDGKNGLDLGLEPALWNARKVCYGIFRDKFPDSAIDATNPALWHVKCPQFWLLSDVLVTAESRDSECDYQTGLLKEMVNLPNRLRPFGPVALTFTRTTARDRTWSYVTYKLINQDAVKVDEGWYLVQRRDDSPHAAIMVKAIEFKGNNDWLDSVCETGLLDGARTLLGLGPDAGERGAPGGESVDAEGGVLTSVLTGYLDGCRQQWDDLGEKNLHELKNGIAEFESKPLRFTWIDSVFGAIENSTSFFAAAASDWANVVQQNLPDALDQTEAATADKATTPAYLLAAAWKTALGVYKVGSDVSRAMLQVLGPGIGTSDTGIVEALNDFEQSGHLAEFLGSHSATDIPAIRQELFEKASRARGIADFHAAAGTVFRRHGIKPSTQDHQAFTQAVLDRAQSPRGRAAGL
jgi:hypothetical protein